MAYEFNEKPIFISDSGDNTTGGAVGQGTEMLRLFLGEEDFHGKKVLVTAIHDEIVNVLAKGDLKPAVNCGHAGSYDEWVHTPVYKGSKDNFISSTVLQCDIIPTPMPDGYMANCGDTVLLADENLRKELEERYPEFWEGVQRRRKFMKEELNSFSPIMTSIDDFDYLEGEDAGESCIISTGKIDIILAEKRCAFTSSN